MSFADISKSLGELAGAIAKKNKEVEELKSEYERKLRVVERYLQHFPGAEPALDANALVTLLENDEPVTCPNCSTTLYDLSKHTGFVLVPKNRLRIQSETGTEIIASDQENLSGSRDQPHKLSEPAKKPYNNRHGSKSKRTCSYCNKTGHSRARCFTRLNGEPKPE
ncbi:hypothetical protein OXX69_004414 [Metschnikowia pulcherrima]